MRGLYILYLLLCLAPSAFCQTSGSRNASVSLPTLTLMDVEPAGSITMNFTPPLDAGRPLVAPGPNTSKWINYSSAIASGGSTKSITASVNQTIPGVDIRLQAANASGAGGGTRGTGSGQVILAATAKIIVSGIGGAYTGNGINNGHQLTITLATNTYANMAAINNQIIVIQYTIID